MITDASIQINKKEQAIAASLGNCHLLIEFKLLILTQVKFKIAHYHLSSQQYCLIERLERHLITDASVQINKQEKAIATSLG